MSEEKETFIFVFAICVVVVVLIVLSLCGVFTTEKKIATVERDPRTEWDLVSSDEQARYMHRLSRIEVPGGWLYRDAVEQGKAVSVCFVPAPVTTSALADRD